MPPTVFPRLLFWDDLTPRTGPESFALDELLLEMVERVSTPLLRRYRWDGHWISFGYFQRWEHIRPFLPPGASPSRRWTGGGTVDHARDETYSLLVPRGFPLASDPPTVSYRRLHRLLAAAFSCGTLAPATDSPRTASGWCFVDQPVPSDLITADGAKIAGAAQRRTACGLLHQGSLALDRISHVPSDAWLRFAASLGTEVEDWFPDANLLAAALRLAETRYASQAWLHRR